MRIDPKVFLQLDKHPAPAQPADHFGHDTRPIGYNGAMDEGKAANKLGLPRLANGAGSSAKSS